jgi:hypothetical protein
LHKPLLAHQLAVVDPAERNNRKGLQGKQREHYIVDLLMGRLWADAGKGTAGINRFTQGIEAFLQPYLAAAVVGEKSHRHLIHHLLFLLPRGKSIIKRVPGTVKPPVFTQPRAKTALPAGSAGGTSAGAAKSKEKRSRFLTSWSVKPAPLKAPLTF